MHSVEGKQLRWIAVRVNGIIISGLIVDSRDAVSCFVVKR